MGSNFLRGGNNSNLDETNLRSRPGEGSHLLASKNQSAMSLNEQNNNDMSQS